MSNTTKTPAELSTIALDVAMNAKASGIGIKDLGCFHDDDWNLTDAEWLAVIDEVGDIYEGVEPSVALRRSWAKVNADFRAEERSERLMFAGDW
jgi:hypothetical protein